MQKVAFDDVACKHLSILLATSAAKELFVKHRNNVDFSFLYHVGIEIMFLFCELSRLTHGVVGQMRILLHSASLSGINTAQSALQHRALSTIIHSVKNYFLNNVVSTSMRHEMTLFRCGIMTSQ